MTLVRDFLRRFLFSRERESIAQLYRDTQYLQNQIEWNRNSLGSIEGEVDRYKSAINATCWMVKYRQSDGRKIILFLFQRLELWPQWKSVVEQALADKRFHVRILLIPWRQPGQSDMFQYCWRSYTFFKKMGIEFEVEASEPVVFHSWVVESDYVFFQTPYDDQRPQIYSSGAINSIVKTCYIPYAYTVVSLPYFQFGSEFYKNCFYVFIESKIHREVVLEKVPELMKKLHVVGHPKLDMKDSGIGIEKTKSIFVWNPRWAITDKTCTLAWAIDAMISFFCEHNDFHLIFRPHPLLFPELAKGRNAELKKKIDTLIKMHNVELDLAPDYRQSFEKGYCLISDASSLLVEFLPFEGPVIYTRNETFELNRVGAYIRDCLYEVQNKEDLIKLMESLKEGQDEKASLRFRSLNELRSTGNAADAILKELI